MATTMTAPAADWVGTNLLWDGPYPTYAHLQQEAPVTHGLYLDPYFVITFRDSFGIEMAAETVSSTENAKRSALVHSMGRPLLRKDGP